MSFKEFWYKNRPTVLFFLFFVLNIIFLVSSELTTSYLNNIRSFLIYFFNFTYQPIYEIIDYPLEVINKFVYIPYLHTENVLLKEKLKKSLVKNLYYKQIIEDLEYKNKIQERKQLLDLKVINAKVVRREPKEWYNECIIKILSSDLKNIRLDLPVVLFGEDKRFYFVGRIWEINNDMARVLLITNPLSNIPVKIKNKPIYGIVVGNSNTELNMDYILLDDNIQIGDVVETVELNGLVGGIEIGSVTAVETISSLGFKKAKIKINFNINKLKNLVILVDS